MDNHNLGDQIEKADKFYRENPERAMLIAMGDEEAPEEILSAVIYAKICNEVEKSKDIDACMRLANSLNNIEISKTAQILKLRRTDLPIETMKEVVNARIKAFEKTLPKGKTHKMIIDEEVKNIKKEINNTELNTKDLENFIDSLI